MQFKENTPVYAADGEDVGTIDRVVLDPQTNEVSHIVVRQGWLFTEDKVVPTDLIDRATENQVRLRTDAGKLDDLPRFEETYYLPYEEAYSTDVYGSATTAAAHPAGYARPYYAYPPIGAAWPGSIAGYYGYPAVGYPAGAPPVATERNIPEGTVALKEGANVIDSNGEQVGEIARVFTKHTESNGEAEQVTHLLISEGWLFKEKRVVPINWVSDVTDNEVQLNVNADFLNRLPEYRQ